MQTSTPSYKYKHQEVSDKIAELKLQKFSRMDKIALWVTHEIGTFRFFLLLSAWTVAWLLWNAFGPMESRFDPFPAFVLWLFISNLIQLLFLPLLMVGQGLQGRHAELRAEIEFEINRQAEEEIHEILTRLEEQQKEIQELLKKH